MSQIFYIFRHAQSIPLGEEYGSRVLTAEVIPEFLPPIRRMADFLKTVPTDVQYSSEVLRCRQTAAIVTEMTGKHFTFDARLNEYNQETFEHFTERVRNFLDEVQRGSSSSILICTHGAVIAALKNFLLKNEFTKEELLDYPDSGILLEIKNGHITKKDFNVQ